MLLRDPSQSIQIQNLASRKYISRNFFCFLFFIAGEWKWYFRPLFTWTKLLARENDPREGFPLPHNFFEIY